MEEGGGGQSASKLENKNQRQRDALTEGREKPPRESEGKTERKARSNRQSPDLHKGKKAHLIQQTLWGIERSPASPSHQV